MYGYGHEDVGEGLYGLGLYGMGYKYPRVRREVKSLYGEPAYLKKWAKAALFNTGLAKKNRWIDFLKNESKVFPQIQKLLQDASREYRAKYGVSASTLKNLSRRIEKMKLIGTEAGKYFDDLQKEYEEVKKYPDFAGTKQLILTRLANELQKLEELERNKEQLLKLAEQRAALALAKK